jgi:hypothetical protein
MATVTSLSKFSLWRYKSKKPDESAAEAEKAANLVIPSEARNLSLV